MVRFQYHNENSRGSKEIIILGADLEDGVIETTKNTI
jgi:hypothetical protein